MILVLYKLMGLRGAMGKLYYGYSLLLVSRIVL